MVYHPVASDVIDCSLANIINNTSKYNFEKGTEVLNKAKMLFVRESEGVYSYCKKKVIIMKDGERLVFRVGGGFMSIEDFIKNYTIIRDPKLSRQLRSSPNRLKNIKNRGSPRASVSQFNSVTCS
jgi:hypothetical protein